MLYFVADCFLITLKICEVSVCEWKQWAVGLLAHLVQPYLSEAWAPTFPWLASGTWGLGLGLSPLGSGSQPTSVHSRYSLFDKHVLTRILFSNRRKRSSAPFKWPFPGEVAWGWLETRRGYLVHFHSLHCSGEVPVPSSQCCIIHLLGVSTDCFWESLGPLTVRDQFPDGHLSCFHRRDTLWLLVVGGALQKKEPPGWADTLVIDEYSS